jgi:dTDP-glucose 4,6-dehydratase
MKRVLLTGVAGFIGSHILEHILATTDWEVVGIASWTHKGTPERIEESKYYQTNKKRVTIITHDLVAPFTEITKKRIGHVDYIINCASESHVDRSITDPVPFVKNNVALVLNMLEFARESKPEIFVQVSTDEVYGVAKEGGDHPEWDVILPSNPYSGSKAAQEAIAISYWRTYGVPVVITNTMNNFGERQDPEKYVAMLIKKIVSGEEVTVHGKPGKIGTRFYLHARNHADAICYIIKNLKPEMYTDEGETLRPSRYNIVGNREIDNLEMAQIVAEILGKPLNYRFDDYHANRPGHDRRYGLTGDKLQKLGWTPPIEFEKSMRKYVGWTLKPENKHWL